MKQFIRFFLVLFLFVVLSNISNSISLYSQDASLISPKDYDRTGVITKEPEVDISRMKVRLQTDEYGEVNRNRVLSNLGGGGRYMSVPDNALLEQSVNGTLEAWVFATTQTTTHMIVSKGSFDLFWGVRQSIGNRMVLTIGGSQLGNADGTVIPINTWTHVAVSWNIAGGNITANFYVNGAVSGSPVVLGGAWVNNATDLRVGDWHGGANNFWAGTIDELRYWNDVRTLDEIRDNRFVGLGDGLGANTTSALTSASQYAGLIASWTFNNTSTTTVFEDISLLDGTLVAGANTAVALNIAPIPYNFVLNRAAASATNYVTVPSNAAFNLTSGGSVECWFYTTNAAVTQWLVGKGSTSTTTVGFGMASTGFLVIRFGATPLVNTGGTPIVANRWYHIAATWSGTPGNYTVNFYVNGAKSGATVTNTGTLGANADPFTLGILLGFSGFGLIGNMDEARIWSSVRTESQIRADMFNSARGLTSNTGLIGAWNFDGNLLNFGTTAGINGSFNVGGANNCKFSAFLNETTGGAITTSFISYNTVVNRTLTGNPFSGGFAMRAPFKPILDNATTRDTITLGGSGTVTSVELFLKVSHTFAADLDIVLRAPNGQTRDITSDNGAGSDNGYLTFFIDGETPVTTASFLPPYSPFAGPEVAMGTFGGSSTNGNWILEVADDAGGDTGTLEGWGIRLNGSLTAIEPVNNNIPGKFSLYQNYPNPFNPISNIKFDIAKATNVKLVVFDILGREVATLVNEYTTPGQYEVQFDGANFASGTYFFRIEAGDFTDIKKMVLVK